MKIFEGVGADISGDVIPPCGALAVARRRSVFAVLGASSELALPRRFVLARSSRRWPFVALRVVYVESQE